MGSLPIRVTLVTAPDCHLCAHARQVLARLAREHPLAVEELAWNDPAAAARLERDGVPFPPALYVEDELWGYGRLSEGRLRRLLARGGAR